MRFKGKVCVVTGASSGIGRRVALDLAAAGAIVCVTARRIERLRDLLEEMGGEEAGHSAVATDVGRRDQVRALAGHVAASYGRCHVLVNNAGFSQDSGFSGPESVGALEEIMQTNFWGTVYCTAELLPLLLEAAPSSVVNVASVAGRIGVGGASAYCASKFAVVGWSEALHEDLRPRGVCVSLVEPGFVATEGFPQADMVSDPVLKHLLGTTEQVSAAILDAVENRKPERIVPRWYHLVQIPKMLTPPLYRWASRKVVAPRQRRRLERAGG